MLLKFIFVAFYLASLFPLQHARSDFSEEFCNSETFKASCSNNEVVVINAAKYGRMNVGKCISERELETLGAQRKDLKFLGCSKDVMREVYEQCKLKSRCEMKVTDLEREDDTFCLPGLKSYFQVNYSCLTIFKDSGDCRLIATAEALYLQPVEQSEATWSAKKECFSKHKPLVLEALKGQRIKLSVKRLDGAQADTDSLSKEACKHQLGYIIGGHESLSNATICRSAFKVHFTKIGTTHASMSTVFETNDNRVKVYFSELQGTRDFLIGVEADGCSDIIPHEDSWLKRNNDDLMVGCFLSPQTWYLRCENRRWIGTLGNCSIHSQLKDSHSEGRFHNGRSEPAESESVSKKHQTLIIMCICGFGVVVCVLILCSGAICLKSYSKKELKNNINNNLPIYQHQQQLAMMTLQQQQQQPHQHTTDYSACEEDRYQVLDRDEVAKQEALISA